MADVDSAPVLTQGALIERHPRFPQRTNVGFMQVVDGGKIRLRVFERGVGETQACGSGACAAVAAGRQLGYLDEQVAVQLPGGDLSVSWKGVGHPLFMTGPGLKPAPSLHLPLLELRGDYPWKPAQFQFVDCPPPAHRWLRKFEPQMEFFAV